LIDIHFINPSKPGGCYTDW